MADGGHGQAAHGLLNPGGLDGGLHGGNDGLLLGSTEAPVEGAAVKRGESVGSGVGAGQRIETETSAVDDGLAKRPEQHRAVIAAQHLGHVSGVGKGQILEDDQIRVQTVEISAQLVKREQHLVRADKVGIHSAQHGAGALEMVLGGFQMIGGDTHRDIDRTEAHEEYLLKLFNAVKYHSFSGHNCQALFFGNTKKVFSEKSKNTY